MRTVGLGVAALALLTTSLAGATIIEFNAFNIRNNNSTITAPWDADMYITENAAGDGFSALTPRSGQKVGYGTDAFEGFKVNQLDTVNWDKISGKAGLVSYLNIWVTDGSGHYAIISSENDYRGTDFGTRTEWKIFEYAPGDNFDWLFDSGDGGRSGAQYLTLNGSNVNLSQLSNRITVFSGMPYGTPGVGTGAPQGGYGFNLIWGDTQANFTSGIPYSLENLTVEWDGQAYSAGVAPVPEPASMGLLGLGLVGLVATRIRKRKIA